MSPPLLEIWISGPSDAVAVVAERVGRVLTVVHRSAPKANREGEGARLSLDVRVPSESGSAPCSVPDLREVKAIVTDRTALRRVTPGRLASYLAARGWVEETIASLVSDLLVGIR